MYKSRPTISDHITVRRLLSVNSVADPGCLSRILIFNHPESRFSDPGPRTPNPKTATKERGEKNMLSHLFCSHKYHKIENYFILKCWRKKIWPSFQRITKLYKQKLSHSSQNMGLRSEIQDPEKTYSWSRIQGSKRHRIPDPDPQHCLLRWSL